MHLDQERVAKILASRDFDAIAAELRSWMNRTLNAEFDSAYYKCIMDGSWPTSVEILERALEKAKKLASNPVVDNEEFPP